MPEREIRSSADVIRTHVVQISNVSPSATRDQLHQMLSYLGRIDEMKVYPSDTNPICATAPTRLCFVKFEDTSSVSAAQHLTNTPLIDRAIICVPVQEDRIPDEETALRTGGPALPGQRVLPSHVINQIQMVGGQQAMVTIDPALSSLGLPSYPPLPSNIDAVKLEETRRTIYVGNVPKDATAEELLDFFNDKIGEVMYMRFAGLDDQPVRYLYVEFASQISVPIALQKNGVEFKGEKLKIQHSTVAIVKPRAKTEDMAKREVEEALKKAEAAGPLVSKALGADADEVVRRYSARNALDNAVSRAAASITRSRSPSWNRDDRRSKGRSKSRSRSKGRRDRKWSRSRSPSWARRRGPRRSPSPRRRSPRDRDRGGRRYSPSRPADRDRDRTRDRDRDRDRRRRRSPSPSESRTRRRSRDEKERDRDKDREKRGDRTGREKEREKETKESKRESGRNASDRDRCDEPAKSKPDQSKESLIVEETGAQAKRIEQTEEPVEDASWQGPMDIDMEKEDDGGQKCSEYENTEMQYEEGSLTNLLDPNAHRGSPKRMEISPRMEELYKKESPMSDREKKEAVPSDKEGGEKAEKSSHVHGSKSSSGKRKEKRKKEKKEKKKKRERPSKKKKSKRHESSGSEEDAVSSSSSE